MLLFRYYSYHIRAHIYCLKQHETLMQTSLESRLSLLYEFRANIIASKEKLVIRYFHLFYNLTFKQRKQVCGPVRICGVMFELNIEFNVRSCLKLDEDHDRKESNGKCTDQARQSLSISSLFKNLSPEYSLEFLHQLRKL